MFREVFDQLVQEHCSRKPFEAKQVPLVPGLAVEDLPERVYLYFARHEPPDEIFDLGEHFAKLARIDVVTEVCYQPRKDALVLSDRAR